MADLGRTMMFLGALVMALGALLWAMGRWGFAGLPGDIRWECRNVRVYLPLATSIALSVLLTALLWLWQWLGRR